MTAIWLVLAVFFAAMAVMSLRSGAVEWSSFARSDRKTQPISFWLFMAFYAFVAIACAALAAMETK
jgi:uncharacterized membrane protein YidH (DUF202 family)